MDKKNNRILSLVKIRMMIHNKKKTKKVKPRQPRYDETFFRGIRDLNKG